VTDLLNALRPVLEALLGKGSTWAVAAAFVLDIVILGVKRYQSRKQLSYRVSYDSKIGLDPGRDHPNPLFEQFIRPLRQTPPDEREGKALHARRQE